MRDPHGDPGAAERLKSPVIGPSAPAPEDQLTPVLSKNALERCAPTIPIEER